MSDQLLSWPDILSERVLKIIILPVRQRVSTDRVLFCLVRAVQSTSKIAVTFRYMAGYSLPCDRLDACFIRVVRKIRHPIIHGGR